MPDRAPRHSWAYGAGSPLAVAPADTREIPRPAGWRAAARRAGLTGVLVLVLVTACAMAALPADASPIPGATYNGVAAGGGTVAFTLSPDGTLVTSYRINPVPLAACQIFAEGDNGVWQGAPIVGGAFTFQFYDAILFQGTFAGAQSAAGTFRLYDHATSATPACDTGTVSWTATTTAAPPPGTSGGGTGSGGNGGAGSGGNGGTGSGESGTRRFATRIVLRKLSRTRLGGRIGSPSGSCRGGRTMTLWRGTRRIASIKSKHNGTFSFPRFARVRGHRVRVSSTARAVRAGVCSAGSSTFIKA